MASTEPDLTIAPQNTNDQDNNELGFEPTDLGPDHVVLDDPSTPKKSTKQVVIEKIILCVALFFPLFLATLDTTVVATALPHIASQFNQLPDQSWIANAYILTNTAFLPAYGQVADIFGRHIVMQSAIFIFLVGSALCTGAQTWGMLLAGRGIAGIGSAGCFVMTKIIMSDTSSLKSNAAQNTYLSIMGAVAYSIGPVLGGVLTAANWRWCFAINLPVCVVAHIIFFVLLRKKVRSSTYDTEGEHHTLTWKLKKIDYIGLILFLGACISLILALVWGGSTYPWSDARIIVLLILGVLLVFAFIGIEYIIELCNPELQTSPGYLPSFLRNMFTHATPMIPLEIFKDIDVCLCQWLNLAGGMIMQGQFYYIAIYFTVVFLYPPESAGKALLYFLPGLGVGAWTSVFFVNIVFRGTKVMLILGGVIMSVATGLFSMAVEDRVLGQLYGFMAMLGVGVGMTLMPTQLHAQARMMHQLATVTSLVSFFRCLGGILGLTIMSSVVNNKVASAVPQLASASGGSGDLASISSISQLPTPLLNAVQGAFANAIRWAYIAILPFACVSALAAFFLREVKIPKKEKAEHQAGMAKEDVESGQIPQEKEKGGQETAQTSAAGSAVPTRKPRIKVWGPSTAIIWCVQALGDKMGWRK